MDTIEPLMFSWEGDGVTTDENYNRRFPEFVWDITTDFVFHEAACELCEEVSPHTLQEEYAEIVDTKMESIKGIVPLSGQDYGMGNINHSQSRDRIYYVRGDSVILPSRRSEGVARIVSNNKDAARDLKNKLASELNSISQRFHGAGINSLKVHESKDFTLKNIEHPNSEIDIETGDPGDFESQVLDELRPLSEAFVSNVLVNFINYPPNTEFDILFASGKYGLLQIEAKDYSGREENPGKEDVIHRPLRKASLLNIDQTISVVKGVDEDLLSELKRNAELREQLQIVEKEELVDAVKPLLEKTTSGTPGFYPIR